MGPLAAERLSGSPRGSDEGVDGVVDVVVGDSTCFARDTVVGLDVLQGFHVPGGGELEGTVDLIEAGDQVLVEGAGATGDQGVGDVPEVVTDVTGALGLAFRGGGVVGALLLGGVGELVVDGLGGAVHELVSFGGEGLGGFQRGLGSLIAAEGGIELGVAEEATLGVGGGNGLGEWSLRHGERRRRGTEGKEDQPTAAAARSK